MDDILYERICDFRNIHRAYKQASAAKRYKSSALSFAEHMEENLLALRDELKSRAYVHGAYYSFIVHDSKKREIMAAPFKDRVMHHALCNVIEPIFDNGFIYDSYACRKEKGTHRAVMRLRTFLRRSKLEHTYIFQGDISKYFNNIDHDILFALVQKKITDPDILRLVRTIIDSANADVGAGIPIGNLTSQLFANVYLNELDQFVKHTLRAKRYIRYMDDFLIVDADKARLRTYRDAIDVFLRKHLYLLLHPKKSIIAPVRLGVDFLGYRLLEKHTRLRTSTVKRFIKRTMKNKKDVACGALSQESFERSIASWVAYAGHADSYRLRIDVGKKLRVLLI